MGAWFTETTSTGRTAGEAFRKAREDAGYESGHGGYSGTIYEKHDYVIVELPKGLTAKRLLSLASDAEDVDQVEYLVDEVRYAKQLVAQARKGHIRTDKARLRKAEKDLAKAKVARDRFWKKVGVRYEDAVRTAAEVGFGDKWGPAVCVPLRGAEATDVRKRHGAKRGEQAFLFFGYASS